MSRDKHHQRRLTFVLQTSLRETSSILGWYQLNLSPDRGQTTQKMVEEKGGRSGILTFSMQIGLVRESVTVEGGELTLSTLKEIACAFVDRKVSLFFTDKLDGALLRYCFSVYLPFVQNFVTLMSKCSCWHVTHSSTSRLDRLRMFTILCVIWVTDFF